MRRRRGPSFVTKIACTECRKGRAKCDGEKPCGRCTSKGGLKCEYEVPVHIRKEEMRQELNELRRYRKLSEKVFNILEAGDQPGAVISKLKKRESLETIVEQLGGFSPGAESSQSGAPSSSLARRESLQTDGATSTDFGDDHVMEDSPHGSDETGAYTFKEGSRWTEVPLTDTVIEHLLLLYFCWEYPIFSSLSKRHFARDFNTGRTDCCSSLLVNGILAVGSRFSEQVEARTDPDDGDTAGLHCYRDAERLLSLSRGEQSITVVQGLCLMSTWNSSRGDYKRARYYSGQAIRMAVEMGLHQDNETSDPPSDIQEARNTAFWGAFMLDQAWSLAMGSLPHISRDGVLIKYSTAFDRDELREWIPYAGDQIPQGLDLRQPSNVRLGYRSLCELSTIIHQILCVMHSDTGPFSSREILDQYTQMLGWYSSLPEMLRLGENSTPSILFVHMYYYFSIILVFYPLMKYEFPDSNISAREICTDAAAAVTTLVRSYESLHGLRRTPCFLPYIIFASGIAHLSAVDQEINPIDTLTQSAQEVAILQLTSLYHGASKRACRVLLSRALYPNSRGGAVDEDARPRSQSPWEPFSRTMIWPATDSSRERRPTLDGFSQLRASDGTPPYQDQSHWDWFGE